MIHTSFRSLLLALLCLLPWSLTGSQQAWYEELALRGVPQVRQPAALCEGVWTGDHGIDFTLTSQTRISPFKIKFNFTGNCSGSVTITFQSPISITDRSFTLNLGGYNSTGSLTGNFSADGNSVSGSYTYKRGSCNTLTGSWQATPVKPCAQPGPTDSAIYAQAALGGPYEMVVIFSNMTDSGKDIKFDLKYGNDQTWPDPWQICFNDSCGSYSRRAGFILHSGSKTTSKFLLRSAGSTRSGYVELSGEPGTSVSDYMVNYFYVYRVQGGIVDSVGVTESPVSKRMMFPVEYTDACNTGFAWAPASDSPGSFPVAVSLYDRKGNLLERRTETMDAHRAIFVSQVFSVLSSPFLGHLEIDSPYEIALTVLRMDTGMEGPQYTVVEAETF